jgi:hypothetical protein
MMAKAITGVEMAMTHRRVRDVIGAFASLVGD